MFSSHISSEIRPRFIIHHANHPQVLQRADPSAHDESASTNPTARCIDKLAIVLR
ncbi:hypothetical protein AVEN_58765-1, partial [Araneus ventricosus]